MKKIVLIISTFCFSFVLMAQEITWQEITGQYTLPEGIKVFKGTRANPLLEIFYAEIDLNREELAIRPYLTTPGTLPNLTQQTGAYLAINSGFFSGSTSVSTVVYPGEVRSENIKAVTRNSQSYPLIRSMFGITYDREMSVDWVYHFGPQVSDIRKFDAPLPYTNNDPNPRPAPQAADGSPIDNLMVGMGGAPVLVKGGESHITYNEEVMWGSGVGLANGDPRTAVGFTADKKVIFMVADGRQSQRSNGVSLVELADILIDLGCVEALNLDGGGSSQMAVPGQYVNIPSEQRNVPSILAVTHVDNLGLPRVPKQEFIIDTEDEEATQVGEGWIQTANAGFYGNSPSMVHLRGNGSAYYQYEPPIVEPNLYEVYGWWVSSFNRVRNTPYIVHHLGGVDTVRVDQVQNGSAWNLIGRYLLDENAQVQISNAGTTGEYVVADAVRFSNYVSTFDVSALEAVDDQAFIPLGQAVNIAVLANDNTYELSAVKVDVVNAPEKGTATVQPNRTIRYTALPGMSGADVFTYRVCVGQERILCGQAQVLLDLEEEEEEPDPVLGLDPESSPLKAYPNPTRDRLRIPTAHLQGTLKVTLFDGRGVPRASAIRAPGEEAVELSLAHLADGFYLLRVQGDGFYHTLKIIKE
jgi:hypothetical protein